VKNQDNSSEYEVQETAIIDAEDSESNEEPEWLIELRELVPQEWLEFLPAPNGAAILSAKIPAQLPAEKVAQYGTAERKIWELVGLYYRAQNRWHDAIAIYSSMYDHFLKLQLDTKERVHKGMPLVWIADGYLALGNVSLSKRFMMLTLIEDAITYKGELDPVVTGSYFRLAWRHGLPDVEMMRYSREAFKVWNGDPSNGLFPEFILQELDKKWIIEVPSPNDAGLYKANTIYISYLLDQLGEGSGKILERLADYVLSCVPGCRTAMRKRSFSTDYDIVCTLEGPEVDFRADLGRYFICECKDWKDPADFSAFAKFARVLDSIKAHFGILFSREGISGEGATENAEREQVKVYQDRGMVIVVIDKDDLQFLANSGNFISLLRGKYEKVRLDLRQPI
jgi:hypothetical protein